NGTQAFVSPFPSSGFAVDWYYNGNLVVGQNGKFLPYLGDGLYSAEVYNLNYSFCRTSAGPDSIVLVSGVSDMVDNTVYDVSVYPNPNSGKFNVNFTSAQPQDLRMVITSTIGQTVVDRKIQNFNGQFNEVMDLTDLSRGVYVLTIESPTGRHNSRIVVQ
ncbi:MAG TPA: T9SS type A sorting domain-containing protein, partial [Chitinophagales bacterium]|nr:T9SS type A sorting domain-containing protein [Chitinophagales bacterium]